MNPIATVSAILAAFNASAPPGSEVIFVGREIQQVRDMLALYHRSKRQAKFALQDDLAKAQEQFNVVVTPAKRKYIADKRSLQRAHYTAVEQARETFFAAGYVGQEAYNQAVHESADEGDAAFMPALDVYEVLVQKAAIVRDLAIEKADIEYASAAMFAKGKFNAIRQEAKCACDAAVKAAEGKFQIVLESRMLLWQQYQEMCASVLSSLKMLAEQMAIQEDEQKDVAKQTAKVDGGDDTHNQAVVETLQLWQRYQATSSTVLSNLKTFVEESAI